MKQVKYYEVIRDMKTKFNYRFHLVQYTRKKSVTAAAKQFVTTPKTVRKWRERFKKSGVKGLEDQSRAPKRVHNKTKELDESIIQITREKYPAFGPKRLISLAGLSYGKKAIANTLKRRGLTGRKKKWKQKRDLREWKKKNFAVLEKWQNDVKYLDDIENFFPQMARLKLPKYEHTFRELISGAAFVAYSFENNTTNSGIFIDYVLQHLKYYGVDTSHMKVQSDNGSEYIGNINKKEGRTPFQLILDRSAIEHSRIPSASPTYNSDVETFHRTIEEEFYSCESFQNQTQFYAKALSYLLFYNYIRPNSGKNNLSPWQIVQNAFPNINPNVLNLQPILLDAYTTPFLKGGYHVRGFPNDKYFVSN
jgi:transposase